jgi:hypothetical protein
MRSGREIRRRQRLPLAQMVGDQLHQGRQESQDNHAPKSERGSAPARYPGQAGGDVPGGFELIRRRTGSGQRLPDLRQVVARDRDGP